MSEPEEKALPGETRIRRFLTHSKAHPRPERIGPALTAAGIGSKSSPAFGKYKRRFLRQALDTERSRSAGSTLSKPRHLCRGIEGFAFGRIFGIRVNLSFLIILCLLYAGPAFPFFPTVGKAPQQVSDQYRPEGTDVKVEVWVDNLEIPWSLLFLSNDKALVSERPGRIRLIRGGKLEPDPFASVEVSHEGEGGLLGLARHPDYPKAPFIYAMHTYRKNGELYNRIIRLKDMGDKGILERVILDNIPGGRFHDGGRIAFGPDGMLYVTTGETFQGKLAQDLKSLGGKILRVTPEGGIPPDNPFAGSSIYTYGHRNPQGLSWHPETKDLFASEHGPSGEYLLFANDEINVIIKGGNYGWPEVVGAPGKKPYIDPLIVWKKTTPPSGITFHDGRLLPQLKNDLLVATLRSQALIRIRIKREKERYRVAAIERWFIADDQDGKYGRLRDVVEGPEGALYFLTSNRDGRGRPRPGDDKIYRIVPR